MVMFKEKSNVNHVFITINKCHDQYQSILHCILMSILMQSLKSRQVSVSFTLLQLPGDTLELKSLLYKRF